MCIKFQASFCNKLKTGKNLDGVVGERGKGKKGKKGKREEMKSEKGRKKGNRREKEGNYPYFVSLCIIALIYDRQKSPKKTHKTT